MNKNNNELVEKIINCFEMTKSINSRYILPAYIERYLYKAMDSPQKEIILIKAIADNIIVDYYMPLLLASHYAEEDNIELSEKYYNMFLQRFEDYHYKGLMLDFFCVSEENHLHELSQKVLDYIERKKPDNNIDRDKLKQLLETELVGYYSVDYKMNYIQGEMPLQNLFYREKIIIFDGSYVRC